MSLQKVKGLLSVFAVGIGLSYPFAVYFGMKSFSPQVVTLFVICLLALRIFLMRKSMPAAHRLIWPSVAALGFVAFCLLLNAALSAKLYPVAMSAFLGVSFIWSVLKPPTVIEMIARITEPDLDRKGVLYTRKVTIVWTVFFVMNALIAFWTALYGTLEQWTLYNGFISYCLMGVLFAIEYLVRIIVRKNEKRADFR
ncbi:MAG: hypothetical protein ABJN40_18185 [Sneathiella sp.]